MKKAHWFIRAHPKQPDGTLATSVNGTLPHGQPP
jgi:hypothetical protein